MFLSILTAECLSKNFNCDSRFNFCALTSKTYNLENFTGKLVFNLDLINGKDNLDKLKNILSNINIAWSRDKDSEIIQKTEIVAKQQEKLTKFTLVDIYRAAGGFTNEYSHDFICNLTNDEPLCLLHKKPDFNEFGFYEIPLKELYYAV